MLLKFLYIENVVDILFIQPAAGRFISTMKSEVI